MSPQRFGIRWTWVSTQIPVFIVTERDDALGRLSAHAIERQEFFDRVRHLAVMFRNDFCADRLDVPGLHPVEPDRINRLLDLPHGKL